MNLEEDRRESLVRSERTLCSAFRAIPPHKMLPKCYQKLAKIGRFRGKTDKFFSSTPTNAKAVNPLFINVYRSKKLVGVVGFEPTAPCSQSRCAIRAALHPD